MDKPAPGEGHGSGRKCGGTNRQGLPCGNAAGKGTDHVGSGNCRSHCGATPTGRKGALSERAQRLLYQYDAEPVADPLTALQALAGRALTLESVIGGIVNDMRSIRYETETGGEQLRSEVAVLERAMDRAGRLLVDIVKLGIEERLAKVTERQLDLLSEALSTVLPGMGMGPDQVRETRQRVARHLRAA
jgi:hypothetical protein